MPIKIIFLIFLVIIVKAISLEAQPSVKQPISVSQAVKKDNKKSDSTNSSVNSVNKGINSQIGSNGNDDWFAKYFSLILSITSILIAIVSAWINLLSPPKISIPFPNKIGISGAPYTAQQNIYTINLNLTFINTGAKIGVIDDIILVLERENRKVVFRTLLEFIEKLNTTGKEIGFPRSKQFDSFIVAGRNMLLKSIVFQQFDNSKELHLTEGKYNVSIFLRIKGSKEFKKELAFNFELDPNDLVQINFKRVTPQEDGRLYVEIQEQIKPIIESEELISNFVNKI